MKKIQKQKLTGFTIIEMIVVMAVFLLIIGAAISIFISVVGSQKRILSEQQLLSQISYVQEYMSKSLRMAKTALTSSDAGNCLPQGDIYMLTRPDSSSGTYKGIKFINQSSETPVCQEFFFDSGVLKEIKDSGAAVALTSGSIQINSVRFSVNGSDGSTTCSDANQCLASWGIDAPQPRVTILLTVAIPGDSQSPVRTFQTTVSQRSLNIAP